MMLLVKCRISLRVFMKSKFHGVHVNKVYWHLQFLQLTYVIIVRNHKWHWYNWVESIFRWAHCFPLLNWRSLWKGGLISCFNIHWFNLFFRHLLFCSMLLLTQVFIHYRFSARLLCRRNLAFPFGLIVPW